MSLEFCADFERLLSPEISPDGPVKRVDEVPPVEALHVKAVGIGKRSCSRYSCRHRRCRMREGDMVEVQAWILLRFPIDSHVCVDAESMLQPLLESYELGHAMGHATSH